MSQIPFRDRVASISPSDGAAAALALVMEQIEIRVDGGSAPDRIVKLTQILSEFPTIFDGLETPCASIDDVSSQEDDYATPDWIENDELDDDIALEQSEWSGQFLVSLWATDPVERRGLNAAFLALLRTPGVGPVLYVPLPEEALPKVVRGKGLNFKVRLFLSQLPKDVSDGRTAKVGEFRADARVDWNAQQVTAEEYERLRILLVRGGRLKPSGVTTDTSDEIEAEED